MSAPPWSMSAPPWSSTAPPQALTGATTDADSDAEQPDVEEELERAESQRQREEVEQPEPERERVDDLPPAYLDIDETFPMKAQPVRTRSTAEHPAQQQAPAFPPPPAYPMMPEPEEGGRNRTAVIVAVVVAVLAVVALVGVGVLVLNRDAAPPAGPGSPSAAAPSASAAGPPPGGLTLKDDSATITLNWTDPAGGGVPFMVAGGRTGQALGVMATVDPGRTSYTVNGLNSRVDYCFTVLAVYSTDSFATSGQVCTEREGDTPSS
ncbi:fibronectin type III domain-containing protein [Micromonospora sp. NBC_01740]|uniref:fibronectin type III domain-containing protein n=1 Tax=unclassified Micromonospora TaxID=2617518 RepID=UPI002E15E2A5|nr:fibronectin type III domain-containing protein [Micromonospora sp. NBC_01740]